MSGEPKKLHRSQKNRIIAGVCAGLGEYFTIDPTIVRIGFVIFGALWGSGIVVYLVMAIVVPLEGKEEAEPQIGARVKETAQELKESAQKIAKDFKGTKQR